MEFFNMKKKWLFAAAAVLSLSLAGCGSNSDKTATDNNDNQNKKVLVMGTSADFAPFEYIDSAKSDEIIGFDVDLANAVTKKNGIPTKNSRYGIQQFNPSSTS